MSVIAEDAVQQENPSKDKDVVIQEALDRKKIAMDAWNTNYTRAEEDINFRDGDQWPENVKQERDDENRPCLTFNRCESFIDQVIGDQRQNRPSIKVRPVELTMGVEPVKFQNEAGDNDYEIAQVYEGLIRNIEVESRAHFAYDTAADHQAGHGFGYIRVLTEYADDFTFDQNIRIKRVKNAFTVLLDPAHEQPDGSDVMYGFIGKWFKRDEAERRFGGAGIATMAAASGELYEHWYEHDRIRYDEYFRRVPCKKKLVKLANGAVVDLGEKEHWEERTKALTEKGDVIIKERVVNSHKVEWYLINGAAVIQGPKTFPSKYIPIIPVYGKELNKKGETIFRGVIRHSKDAQRNHNYWMTAATERVALSPKAPWVGPADAFEGYEDIWETANTKNHSYLPFNPKSKVPPERTPPADMPVAELQMVSANVEEMKATTSLHDASLGRQSNETSGKAILARQREGDTANFAYIDNLSRAIEHVGRILVDMIPKIYDTERVVRIRNEDESEDFVRINAKIYNEETGKEELVHDIGAAKFDVVVKVGPSYTTQRVEAANSLIEFMQAIAPSNPQIPMAISDLIAQNMDWPGADELVRRLRKLVPPELLKKDEGLEDQGPQPPTPEQELQAKEIEARFKEADAKIAQADAKVADAEAKLAQALEKIENLDESIRDAVAASIAELMQQLQGQPTGQPQQV